MTGRARAMDAQLVSADGEAGIGHPRQIGPGGGDVHDLPALRTQKVIVTLDVTVEPCRASVADREFLCESGVNKHGQSAVDSGRSGAWAASLHPREQLGGCGMVRRSAQGIQDGATLPGHPRRVVPAFQRDPLLPEHSPSRRMRGGTGFCRPFRSITATATCRRAPYLPRRRSTRPVPRAPGNIPAYALSIPGFRDAQ